MSRIMNVAVAVCVVLALSLGAAFAGEASKTGVQFKPVVEPKPLSENVKLGLKWLAAHQNKDGGWGQGEESAEMGHGEKLKDISNVADTCMATLALMRAGSSPTAGDYSWNVREAISFVCVQIEESDTDSLFVTKLRGTRVQSKLGQYIDTFVAVAFLSEAKGRMPEAVSEKRVEDALDKALAKMQKNQRKDGTWGSDGWAGVVSQGMAAKGINQAAQKGAAVDEKTRIAAEKYSQGSFDSKSGRFDSAGSAGVPLYATGSNYAALRQAQTTYATREKDLRDQAASGKDERTRKDAADQLKNMSANAAVLAEVESAMVKQIEDKQFVSGFGSNGGEEFLSYMNIGEGLILKGGEEWQKWDQAMTGNMNRIQNQDGSWTGHHCITGRTFCTSAALLVLAVDRATVPVAAQVRK